MKAEHHSGISAECIAASIYEGGPPIYTVVTRSPKFIDAECLSGSTELHFERLTGKFNKDGTPATCLGVMTIDEFYNKWINGIQVPVQKLKSLDVSNIEPTKTYTEPDLSMALGKYSDFVGYLRRNHSDFPTIKIGSRNTILGKDFLQWYSVKNNTITNVTKPYKATLSKMDLRCINIESFVKEATHITDIWQSGVKEVFEVSSANTNIRASENHLFLTQRGWVKVKDLDIFKDSVVKIIHQGEAIEPKNYLSFNRSQRPRLLSEQKHKCADCFCDVDIHCDVHHIKPVSAFPELAFETTNIVALCQKCHKNRHVGLKRASVSPKLYKIDSIASIGYEMTYDISVEHEDSNFVANGFVVHNCRTHRMLSQNSSSSRAIPVSKIIEQVNDDPYIPFEWRKNQSGMQGFEILDKVDTTHSRMHWLNARDDAVHSAKQLAHIGVHKQHVNRLLEPFMWQWKVITATEWDNFFNLRCHAAAQPEMQALAHCIRDAIDSVEHPVDRSDGSWHLPFIPDEERIRNTEESNLMVSTARCARISYANHGDKIVDRNKDSNLASMLLTDRHHSPFEHQARKLLPEDRSIYFRDSAHWSGNFKGWLQHRKGIESIG